MGRRLLTRALAGLVLAGIALGTSACDVDVFDSGEELQLGPEDSVTTFLQRTGDEDLAGACEVVDPFVRGGSIAECVDELELIYTPEERAAFGEVTVDASAVERELPRELAGTAETYAFVPPHAVTWSGEAPQIDSFLLTMRANGWVIVWVDEGGTFREQLAEYLAMLESLEAE